MIAGDFVRALHAHTRQEVVAVGSRDATRAASFAEAHGIPTAHESYDRLLADGMVDAVYVATPMSEHAANARDCIDAGKAVLVEKSFTRTADEARYVRSHARERGVFVMEAMKTVYLPHMQVLRRLLADGVLGAVDTVQASYGGVVPFEPRSRLFDPALGGGVLLDVGVYPLSFAYSVLGPFDRVQASGTLAPTGVDDGMSAVLDARAGGRAVVSASWRSSLPARAAVHGADATVTFGEPFHNAAALILSSHDARTLSFADLRRPGRQGLCHQANAMAGYIAEGRTESPIHSLDDSVAVMDVLDRLRHSVGASFDDEATPPEPTPPEHRPAAPTAPATNAP